MSLTKQEKKALRIFAKTCERKNEYTSTLRATRPHDECEFEGCCLNCFLSGKIHRVKTKGNVVQCGEELHDYFDHNTILTDEYPLAGLREEDVEKAVRMLKEIRGGMEPGPVVAEFLRK